MIEKILKKTTFNFPDKAVDLQVIERQNEYGKPILYVRELITQDKVPPIIRDYSNKPNPYEFYKSLVGEYTHVLDSTHLLQGRSEPEKDDEEELSDLEKAVVLGEEA